MIYLGINAILPGNLLSIETYIQISENRLPCVLRVRGGGVHDVYTRWLVTVNYSLYTHLSRPYLCLNLYVYLYLRSFLDIFISYIMYLTFHYSM